MLLFYAAGASSQASHILLREAELPFGLERVDLVGHEWSGGDYRHINAKSYVPALRLDDGDLLTEGAVILQYIADQVPERGLLPAVGTRERYHALSWLVFIATELHKNFITPERHGGVAANFLSKTEFGQGETRARVSPRLAYVDQMLAGRDFLLGDRFSAPDAYLFTMLTWARRLSLDIAQWPNLTGFFDRVMARPTVREVLDVEGPPHSLLER
ncbi:glutathione transferase GstA [Burkholderia catarinensis]|uniref:glutathione transferase GstA n=1 Tax=Burkholderia catarinensis TaxID=1108140 RepID=UPI00092300CF|nr:glutathione transferase GstA [Burkholderia catarinensis]KAG8151665.1 glutathione transferase GstA [Burkholderia catarinensis]